MRGTSQDHTLWGGAEGLQGPSTATLSYQLCPRETGVRREGCCRAWPACEERDKGSQRACGPMLDHTCNSDNLKITLPGSQLYNFINVSFMNFITMIK